MPKMKTRKAAAKRFKFTKTGKIKRARIERHKEIYKDRLNYLEEQNELLEPYAFEKLIKE